MRPADGRIRPGDGSKRTRVVIGRRGWGSERGAAAVEFALIAPLLCLLVFAIISYAYMFSFRQALTQAAAEGARAAVGGSVSSTPCAQAGPYTAACPAQAAAADGVRRAMDSYGMACGTKNLTCTITAPTTAGCSSGHSCVSVTVSYPYRDKSLLPTFPGLGVVLPKTITFTSSVVVR
jgi:Flp pilus assembly protein TadG